MELNTSFDVPIFGGVDLASGPDICTVTLSKDGSIFAIVDADAMPLIAGRTWSASPCGKGKIYAKQIWCKHTKKNVNVYMHRLLAKWYLGEPPKKGMVVDHIDGNGLNNRRNNFRWLDAYENRWRYARHKQ